MAKEVTFEIDENLTPFAGIALIDCLEADGKSSVHLLTYENRPVDKSIATGLLVLGLSHVEGKSVIELMQVNAQHQAPGSPQKSWQAPSVALGLAGALFVFAVAFFFAGFCS